jgi:Methyltransferase domain
MVKGLVRHVGHAVGLDIRRAQPRLGQVAEPWDFKSGMANRHWRPETLGYTPHPRLGEDNKLKYLLYFLDVRGWRVLELGPWTGHHTVLLDKMGAREIVGIEGREDNLRVCNQIRDRYQLPAAFVLQDIEELAAGTAEPDFEPGFDLVFCLGLFYHLADPKPVLEWTRKMAPRLFLGTHHVETAAADHYKPPTFVDVTYRGQPAKGFREKGLDDPLGGMRPQSTWLTEDHLIELLRDVGYSRIDVLGKDIESNHPHITILAED